MKMKKILGAGALFLLIVGCIQSTARGNDPAIKPNSMDPVEAEIHEHNIVARYASENGVNWNQAQKTIQERYGITNERELFAELPTPPDTFWADANRLYSGKIEVVDEIPANVYRQPEFHPTFERDGIPQWTQAKNEGNRIGVTSLLAEQESRVETRPNEIRTILFISSAWGVTRRQAIGFRATITPDAPIQVVVEPNGIVLGSTFPTFSPDWIQKIAIRLKWGSPLKAGTYRVTLHMDAPPETTMNEWDENTIYPGSGGIAPSNGLATLILHVNEAH